MTGLAANQRAIGPVATVLGLIGTAAIIGGTFAPWVNSGAVSRNLYRITGIAARIGLLGLNTSVTTFLPLLGPVCLVPVVLGVLGARRSAAVLALLVAVACGGFAATVMVLAAGRSALGISLAGTGPIVVLVGAIALAAAGVLLLARARRPPVPSDPAAGIGTNPLGEPSH